MPEARLARCRGTAALEAPTHDVSDELHCATLLESLAERHELHCVAGDGCTVAKNLRSAATDLRRLGAAGH